MKPQYVTSKDLSKRLWEAGFRGESENWWWDGTGLGYELIQYDSLEPCDRKERDLHGFPAYHSGELLNALPTGLGGDGCLRIMTGGLGWTVYYADCQNPIIVDKSDVTLVNAAAQMMLWCIKKGL